MKVLVNARSPWGVRGDEVDIEDSPTVQKHIESGTLSRVETKKPVEKPKASGD